MTQTIVTSLIIIVLMLVLSAFFSGMELAFLNKNRLKMEIDRKQSRVFDYIAGVFSRHQGQYITTILVGNNIALVVYSLCMSQLLRIHPLRCLMWFFTSPATMLSSVRMASCSDL